MRKIHTLAGSDDTKDELKNCGGKKKNNEKKSEMDG